MVSSVLARASDDEHSKAEQLEALAEEITWPLLLADMLRILRDGSRSLRDCRVATEVLWGAVLDKRAIDGTDVIAHLLLRYEIAGPSEDNLAWSIVARLRGVSYLSEYRPSEDPDIQARLAELRG